MGLADPDIAIKFGSSVKSMSEFWLRKLAKYMI
jgi:hypothetical protein